jgi:hypothetical protein
VDILVTPSSNPKVYDLKDRLGRAAGEIQCFTHLGCYVMPRARGALHGLPRAMFPTLNDAMAAIARHTRGACQLASGGPEQRWPSA